ncbi:hypothetical protein [Oricola cellulosilytica]|uniref:Phage holin family protein n=1 Tax=Oricola cellulosilytica TaxID=1429082 RepID=A0A4R0PFB7_9HYPH|nr:hypothetical protein [Oricola cellulosilytica]TCD15095.1 hypothetical protein E0D97_05980 [Oricola cellulosilytica]
MFTGIRGLFRLAGADIARMKARLMVSGSLFGLAGFTFLIAILLAAGAGIVALVENFGIYAGLLIGSGLFVIAGLFALVVNWVLARRHRRRKKRSSAARAALIANAAAVGATPLRKVSPALVPILGIAAFVLTNIALSGSDEEDG